MRTLIWSFSPSYHAEGLRWRVDAIGVEEIKTLFEGSAQVAEIEGLQHLKFTQKIGGVVGPSSLHEKRAKRQKEGEKKC